MPVTQVRGRIAPVRGEDAPPKIPLISGHMWVPIDDVTCSVFNFSYSADPNIPLTAEFALASEADYGRGPDDLTPDGRLKKNRANDFMIDRDTQKTRSFTGIDGINTQDVAVQEVMGPIASRLEELLCSTLRAIAMMRRLLLDATSAVAAESRPRGVANPAHRR